MSEIEAKAAIGKIVADLSDRRGLSGEWDQIDNDVREEIVGKWSEIVATPLREAREQALREAAETFNFIKAIRIAEEAMDTWKNKPHNAKWWRKIDGTPIPNDLLVNIAEAFRDAALSLIEKPKAPSP